MIGSRVMGVGITHAVRDCVVMHDSCPFVNGDGLEVTLRGGHMGFLGADRDRSAP